VFRFILFSDLISAEDPDAIQKLDDRRAFKKYRKDKRKIIRAKTEVCPLAED
jgi:hypothetical protein